MGATPLLSITGRVLEISKGYIPRVDVAKIVSQEGNITITMDVHKDIRIFHFEDEGKVFICEIGRHSDDSYERLRKRGVWRRDYRDFREFDVRWSG